MTTTLPTREGDASVSTKLPEWLPPTDRDGMWGLKQIADAANVSYAAASKWRNNYKHDVKAGRQLGPSSLPKEDDTDDTHGHRWGFPKWRPETVIRWLIQTGRMDEETFRPIKLRGKTTDDDD